MNDLNLCQFIGRLGQDPEMRYTQAGTPVARISLACNRERKDQQGQTIKGTEWIRIICMGKVAEIAGQYLRKGDQAYIAGELQTRKWQDQSGQDRYTTEVLVAGVTGRLQMLQSANHGPQQEPQPQAAGGYGYQQQGPQQAPPAGYGQPAPRGQPQNQAPAYGHPVPQATGGHEQQAQQPKHDDFKDDIPF